MNILQAAIDVAEAWRRRRELEARARTTDPERDMLRSTRRRRAPVTPVLPTARVVRR